MKLYLVESSLKEIKNTNDLDAKVSGLQNKLSEKQASLIELQVAKDFTRSFFIIEAETEELIAEVLGNTDFSIDLMKEVRLVGDDLEKIKQESDHVNYLVEWNLPEDLTMDQYLARKKKNSVHYEEVPEVSFARTYVCEDMSKCLCFYDAPDEDAVKRAREAVKTPIDSITEIIDK